MKLPRIVATQQIPGSIPGGYAGPGAFGGQAAQVLAEGVAQSGRGVQRAADQFARAEQVLRQSESRVEVSEQFTTLKEQLAASEALTRGRLGQDLHPDQYTDEVVKGINALVQQSEASLRYPESRGLFREKAGLYVAEQRIKARADGLTIQHTILNTREDLELDKLANDAVYAAGQADKDAARDRGLEIIEGGLAGGRRTSAEVKAQSRRFVGNITRGRILSEFNDPAKQEQIIGLLESGRYPTLDPDDQVKFATELRGRREAQQRETIRLAKKQEEEEAKAAEVERVRQVDELDARADAGELTAEELRQARLDRIAVDDDFRRLSKKVQEGTAVGGRTDDAVYNRLELDLLENPRSHSAREIRRVQSAGKLAASGPRSAASLLKLIPDPSDPATAAARDISQNHLFKQGKSELMVLRGGAGPLESITGEQRERLENAEREYYDIARSGKVAPEQLPEVARKIVDRLRAQTPLTGDPAAQARLRYKTPEDLLAAKKAGLVPDAEFNRQFKLMQDLGLIKLPAAPTGKPSGGR